MPIHIVSKPIGKTPLQVIRELQKNKKISKKASVAGKLDPMAKGLLKILTDLDCKHQDLHIKDDKVYEWDLILGIKTDSGDILGIPQICNKFNPSTDKINDIEKHIDINIIKGKRIQNFSEYSSINVFSKEYGRKPMWWYAKNKLLDIIKIPFKEINIYDFNIISKDLINLKNLKKLANNRINKLEDNGNNFRQNEILNEWNNLNSEENFIILKCSAHVSSGCYIRELSKEIAENLNTYGIAFDINRKKIGNYRYKTLF